MKILNEVNPPLSEVLEHHGVKGMKWGVRRNRTADIHDARAKVSSEQRMINNQIDKTNTSTGKAQTREAQKLNTMMAAHLRNPDRATALRMTRGEKTVLGLLAVATAPSGLIPIGIGIGAGLTVHNRHKIERSQGTR